MTAHVVPRSTCQVCGGRCYDAGLLSFQDRWLHVSRADWWDQPHDAIPLPRDRQAAQDAFHAGYGWPHARDTR